jgi:hypothetical protein
MLRLSRTVDVLPSLEVDAALSPSRSDLHSFLLRLTLRNMQV